MLHRRNTRRYDTVTGVQTKATITYFRRHPEETLHVNALWTSPGSALVTGRLMLVSNDHRNLGPNGLRRDPGTTPLTLFHSIYTIHHLQRTSGSGRCEAE